jgi:hypothetical protein
MQFFHCGAKAILDEHRHDAERFGYVLFDSRFYIG